MFLWSLTQLPQWETWSLLPILFLSHHQIFLRGGDLNGREWSPITIQELVKNDFQGLWHLKGDGWAFPSGSAEAGSHAKDTNLGTYPEVNGAPTKETQRFLRHYSSWVQSKSTPPKCLFQMLKERPLIPQQPWYLANNQPFCLKPFPNSVTIK